MTLDDVSRLLIVLAAVDWALTAMIYIAARRISEPSLTERATTSVILSIIASIAAYLGAARLGVVAVDNGTATVLLVTALCLVSLPQFIWSISLAAGRFR